jgi:hypothetical protein
MIETAKFLKSGDSEDNAECDCGLVEQTLDPIRDTCLGRAFEAGVGKNVESVDDRKKDWLENQYVNIQSNR